MSQVTNPNPTIPVEPINITNILTIHSLLTTVIIKNMLDITLTSVKSQSYFIILLNFKSYLEIYSLCGKTNYLPQGKPGHEFSSTQNTPKCIIENRQYQFEITQFILSKKPW